MMEVVSLDAFAELTLLPFILRGLMDVEKTLFQRFHAGQYLHVMRKADGHEFSDRNGYSICRLKFGRR